MTTDSQPRTMQISHQYEYHKDTCECAAQAHLIETNGTIWLTNVYIAKEYRGQHLVRPLIEQAIHDFADRTIYLKSQPYADAPMDIAALQAFYESFGFESTGVPDVMVRWPTE